MEERSFSSLKNRLSACSKRAVCWISKSVWCVLQNVSLTQAVLSQVHVLYSFIPLLFSQAVSPWGDTQNHEKSLAIQATSPWKHLVVWEGSWGSLWYPSAVLNWSPGHSSWGNSLAPTAFEHNVQRLQNFEWHEVTPKTVSKKGLWSPVKSCQCSSRVCDCGFVCWSVLLLLWCLHSNVKRDFYWHFII